MRVFKLALRLPRVTPASEGCQEQLAERIAEQWSGVHTQPLAVGRSELRGGRPRRSGGSIRRATRGRKVSGHSPASLASPRAASCSRRRAPSAAGRPGKVGVRAGRGGVEFQRTQAQSAFDGAHPDVHVLHPAVGNCHGPLKEDPAADQEVVIPFGIADGPHLAGISTSRQRPTPTPPRAPGLPATAAATATNPIARRPGAG